MKQSPKQNLSQVTQILNHKSIPHTNWFFSLTVRSATTALATGLFSFGLLTLPETSMVCAFTEREKINKTAKVSIALRKVVLVCRISFKNDLFMFHLRDYSSIYVKAKFNFTNKTKSFN